MRARDGPLEFTASAMNLSLRSLLDDARPERPRRPRRADVALALTLAALVLSEVALRRSFALYRADLGEIAVALLFAALTMVRASAPLIAVFVAFCATIAHTFVERRTPHGEGLFSALVILALPYALARWGSRREITVGLSWMAAAFVINDVLRPLPRPTDVVAGAAVLMLPVVIGATVRLRDEAHKRAIDTALGRERAELARELHDSVAHHIAAITLQAQAAQAVLRKRPEAALGALRAIEEESARALNEMRRLVGALRSESTAAPARIEAIDALAHSAPESWSTTVEREGTFDDLAPSVHSAVYRIAQEAITNAVKHGKSATSLRIRITRDDRARCVRLSVRNDGATASLTEGGFGLLGMRERARLLGGTLDARPLDAGGFLVEATIPFEGTG